MTLTIWLLRLAAYPVLWFFLAIVGNQVCSALLKLSRIDSIGVPPRSAQPTEAATVTPTSRATTEPSAGAWIGALERSLILLGLAAGSWEVVTGVVALKAVARFKELDHRVGAEYFLVGSLVSLVWAILVSAAMLTFDKHCGFNLAAMAKAVLPSAK